jgi:flagellar biogenesis protein FliO
MNAHFNGRKLVAQRPFRRCAAAAIHAGLVATACVAQKAFAQTNLTSASVAHELPDSASGLFSLLRVLGALALVFAIFFGGLWLFRNWQRAFVNKGRAPRLDVLEVKSLGQRHALYVVGYENQRMLVASSPAGITMLTTLPDDELNATNATDSGNRHKPGFTEALRFALQRK